MTHSSSLAVVVLVLVATGLDRPRPQGHSVAPSAPAVAGIPPISERGQQPPILLADSDFFDPDGYYKPEYGLTLSGYYWAFFDLHTLDYYYDGRVHYDDPRFVPPTARVSFEANNSRSLHECAEVHVNRDTLDIRCPDTPVGVLRIAGKFLDKRGQFWNRADLHSGENVLLVARVTVTKGGRTILSQSVRFTYLEGD